jgi:uncharacterized protein HemX
MQFHWDDKIGMASVLTVLGTLGQAAFILWQASSFKTSVTDQFVAVDTHFSTQTEQIKQAVESSNNRFKVVHTELAAAKTAQADENNRLSKIETAFSYISNQIMRVEAKLDGGPPTPALPPPAK